MSAPSSSNSSSSSSSSSSEKTVRFNVGGKVYEVSRSLLEQHPDTMLARLSSDTWSGRLVSTAGRAKRFFWTVGSSSISNTNDGALFIERNGDRFQYVLDYMRDGGTVVIPPSVSGIALCQDLVYFGFEDVDPTRIHTEMSVAMFKQSAQFIDSLIDDLKKELDLKQQYVELAIHCLREYKKNFSLETLISRDQDLGQTAATLASNRSNQDLFNNILKPVGLKFVSSSHNGFIYQTLRLDFL